MYNLDIRYRKGKDNVVPDAISRRPDWMGEGPRNLAAPAERDTTLLRLNLIKGYDEDEWILHMEAYLTKGTLPPPEIRENIKEMAGQFHIGEEGGNILHSEGNQRSPYIPRLFRRDFLNFMHSSYGHLGYPGLQGVIRGRGWWHDVERDIREFAKYCPSCQCAQRSLPNQERELPHTLATKELELFDRWAIDLIGPLPQSPEATDGS